MADNNFDQRIGFLLEALEKMNEKKTNHWEYSLIKIEPFDGEGMDPVEWLKNFEKAAQANNWSEERQILLAPTFLKKTADRWYKALHNKPETIEDFKEEFLIAFRTATQVIEWRRELELCWQKDKTVDQYTAIFRGLIEKVYRAEANLDKHLHQYIQGLKPEIIDKGLVVHAQDFTAAVNSAKGAEATLQYMAISKALEAVSNPPKKTLLVNQDSQINDLQREIAKLKTALMATKKEEEKSRRNNQLTCFNCGSPDYFAKDCPQKTR